MLGNFIKFWEILRNLWKFQKLLLNSRKFWKTFKYQEVLENVRKFQEILKIKNFNKRNTIKNLKIFRKTVKYLYVFIEIFKTFIKNEKKIQFYKQNIENCDVNLVLSDFEKTQK